MKTLLLCGALLLARPVFAQPATAGEAPSMLADVTDELETAHLKLLKKRVVTLKPAADAKSGGIVLLADGLSIRISVAEFAKARSAAPKVQQKYTRAEKYLREAVKAGRTTIELNQPSTRDLEHVLAAWALPQGRVMAITWHDQPITSYTVESYGGGPNQAAYPEGQIFYCYEQARTTGFYVYMNVPKTK
jgi:hypothetical protein